MTTTITYRLTKTEASGGAYLLERHAVNNDGSGRVAVASSHYAFGAEKHARDFVKQHDGLDVQRVKFTVEHPGVKRYIITR